MQDTRDGSSSYRAMITPWRPVCQNTNRFALRDAVSTISLRHTSGLPSAIEKARTVLGLTVEYAEPLRGGGHHAGPHGHHAGRVRGHHGRAVRRGQQHDQRPGVQRAQPAEEESTRTKLANDRREDDLTERFAVESNRVGRTLYAAEQAYTGHLDWGKVRKGATPAKRWQGRIEASLDGEDDKAKNRAHAKLLTLTNR